MEDESLKEGSRTPSPIEEESFRKKILENRHKLRTDENTNGFNSETEGEWETENAETDSESEQKEDTDNNQVSIDNNLKKRMRKDSSSSSSESSDSDIEETPHPQIEKEDSTPLAKDDTPSSSELDTEKKQKEISRTSENENISTHSDEDKDSSSIYSEEEEPHGFTGSYDISPVNEKSIIPSHSDHEADDDNGIIPGKFSTIRSRARSSSSSSSDSDEDERGEIDKGNADGGSEHDGKRNLEFDKNSSPGRSDNEDTQDQPTSPVEKLSAKELPVVLDTPSSSSSESGDENDRIPSASEKTQRLPSSSSSSDAEEENLESKKQLDEKPIRANPDTTELKEDKNEEYNADSSTQLNRDSSSSSSSESEEEGEQESGINANELKQPKIAALHGQDASVFEDSSKKIDHHSSSSSSSSSDSEMEAESPIVVNGTHVDDEQEIDSQVLTPLSLKKALEQRERELKLKRQEEADVEAGLGARRPSEHAHAADPHAQIFPESYSPEAFDFDGDPSLRARTASDFGESVMGAPPKLPPKQRNIPVTAPDIGVHRQRHSDKPTASDEARPNIYHVKDKTASLGRGMWSDDGDDSELSQRNQRHHPPADRVIDFSNNPDGDHSLKRSRSGRKRGSSRKRSKDKRRSRSRSPSGSVSAHRVIDFDQNPYEDPRNAINKQALVSLHANTYDTDAYDTVPETGDELNKLIEKANSLGYHHRYPGENEDVFPKTKLREKNLDSKHQDAFAKIIAPLPVQAIPPEHQYSSDTSKRSSRSLSKKKRKNNPPVEAVDGDDEISLAESDINRFTQPSPPPPEPSLPFVTEIYPSDYTEFESFSEGEFLDQNVSKPERVSSFMSEDTLQDMYNPALQTGGESAYDTVADNDQETDIDISPKAHLNPIVSSNFQIVSDINGSKSFPARLREGKRKKERPGLEHLAIPLHQSSKKKNAYPQSLPYFGQDFTEEEDDFDRIPRRTGSVDDIPGIYPIANPSIIVHRQATHPKGYYQPPIIQETMVQNSSAAPPLPKKEKKKKDKKQKEQSDKVPQIHVSVGQAEGEANNSLNNNLQINVLPSDDPNIINLNIRSTSVNPTGPQSLPVVTHQPSIVYPEPTYPRNQESFVAAVHSPPFMSLQQSQLQDNQHRVVDVSAPPMIQTGDDLPPPVQYSTNGGVMMAGGVATEILPNPILAAAAPQQYGNPQPRVEALPPAAQQSVPYPTISLGAEQQTSVYPPALPATQSLPVAPPQAPPPVLNTTVSSAPVQQPSLQPNNQATVVNVESPWPLPEDRHSSLPSSLRNSKSERMHQGDSGIDLTVHGRSRHPRSKTPKNRRRRSASRSSANRSTTSSSDEGSRRRRRPSSQKKFKSHDYLAERPTNEYMEWYSEKHLKPSCCYLFAKHLMFAINFIFTLAGLALVGFGIWGLIDLHQNGITDPEIIFLDPLFAVLVIGFVVTLVAFHGAAGFVRDNICMLKCFGSLLVILCILFTVGGIVFWAMLSQVKEFTISRFNRNIEMYNLDTRVGLSYSIDVMQSTFECCGMEKPQTSQWSRNELFKCTATRSRCPLPKSCCRTTADSKLSCHAQSDLKFDKPCVEAMSKAVKNNTPVIIGVWLGIWAFMMIEMVCIYFMCKEIQYLQKIRNFLKDPVKHMRERRQTQEDDASDEDVSDVSSDESSSETDSSEEEYRRRKSKNRKKREKRTKNKRDKKRKNKNIGGRTTSKRGRRGSYHVNRTFSIQDERSSHGKRSRRGSRHSRGRRGSY
uniref:uncharacterized protein LOC120347293 isoform X2 n=1 Tax=Styela clava TaxID=7725 RepID=UPI0019394BDC|nr:uncharacterized protein LOC120347293 isoform X2 [Styela clava]